MKLFLIFLAAYVSMSIVIYLVMANRYKTHPILHMPKSKFVYYFLSFTWGFPMALVGLIVALIFIICGKKPKKYGWNWYFEVKSYWGLELGIFFIAPCYSSKTLKNHEHGHSIQNIYFGIFTPAVVSIPSAIRFWYREFRHSVLKRMNSSYDSIWFEGQATMSGAEFIERNNNGKL